METPKIKNEMFDGQSLQLLISQDEILERLVSVAHQIDHEYLHKDLVILTIMKGSICLAADLIRRINIPFTIEFVQVSSYGMSGKQPGALHIFGMDRLKMQDKDVLIVDDIFDSGKTLYSVVEEVNKMHPCSLKSLVLLKKKVARQVALEPNFSLFDIEDHFVVGYGLDYKEQFRGLSGIYLLNTVS